jgi:hypothetical protein
MRRLAVLLVLGAATCRSAPAPETPTPESIWVDLGPPPAATDLPHVFGPVQPDAPGAASPAHDEPLRAAAVEPVAPIAPIAHTGGPPAPEPLRPALHLPVDAVVSAHGPRTLPFAAWPKPSGAATLTTWFLAPEHVPAARRGLAASCSGSKPNVTKVRNGVIALDKAFPYKFGAACLELALDGYPPARAVVQSTDLSVSLRYDLDAVHALVTSLTTGAAVAARLTLVTAGGQLVWSGTTDPEGAASMPGVRQHAAAATSDGPLTLVASAGADFVSTTLLPDDGQGYLGAYGGQGAPAVLRPEASITTGRTHYRAGERVFIHGLVRLATPTQLRLPADGPMTWSATAYDGEQVVVGAESRLVEGAFSAQLDLPAGVAPGPFRMRFAVAGAGDLGHTIHIVGRDLPFHARIGGEGTRFGLTASTDATTIVRIVATPASAPAVPGWQVGPAEFGLHVPPWATRRQTQDLGRERTAVLKAGVPSHFDFKAPDGPWTVQLEAAVTDAEGRTLVLRDQRSLIQPAAYGLVAPAAAVAGPCPALLAADLRGAAPRPITATVIGPDGVPTPDCRKPGHYRIQAGPAGETARWMFVYDPAIPPPSPVLERTTDGVLLGLPAPPTRALLTVERGGIVHAAVVAGPGPWVRVPLAHLGQWAPSATVTVLAPRTTRSPAHKLRLSVDIPSDVHTIPVRVDARAQGTGVAGTVTTQPGATVQLLCVDAKAARQVDPTRSFWHPWSEGALAAMATQPAVPGPPAPATTGGPAQLPRMEAAPHPDHPLRDRSPLPSFAVNGMAPDGSLPFNCPNTGGGTVSVLARAATRDRFGAGRVDVEVAQVALPAAAPAPSPRVGAAYGQQLRGVRRVQTDTAGAHSLDILVGNSALAAIEQPLRRLVESDLGTLDGATRRLVGLTVGKPLLPTLALPGLDTPTKVHTATREAVRAVLDHQNDDGSFADARSSVTATMALHLAVEAGIWVSPRQLERALRHLHRYHLVVPKDGKNANRWVWRAWFVRKLSGASDEQPAYEPAGDIHGQSDRLFNAARTDRTALKASAEVVQASLGPHGHWGPGDLWATAAWGEYASATPRAATRFKVWVGERGALDASLRGKRHAFARVRVPTKDLGKRPPVTVSADPHGWVGLTLTVRP